MFFFCNCLIAHVNKYTLILTIPLWLKLTLFPPHHPQFLSILNKCSEQYPCIQIFSVMVGRYLLTLTLNLPSSLRITNCCGMPCSEAIPSMLDLQCKNWDSPRSISWCL